MTSGHMTSSHSVRLASAAAPGSRGSSRPPGRASRDRNHADDRHPQGFAHGSQPGPPVLLGAGHAAIPDERGVRDGYRYPVDRAPGLRLDDERALGPFPRVLRRPGRTLDRACGLAGGLPGVHRDIARTCLADPARPAEPDVIYAGTQPSALFRSENRGIGFEIVRPLWDHPHRPQWDAGYGGQAIHSILPTRTASWSPCPPAACTGPRTAGTPGRPPTRASGSPSCRTPTPSSASACTRSPRIPTARTASTCRTTSVCTAATTGAASGYRSLGACPPTSAS